MILALIITKINKILYRLSSYRIRSLPIVLLSPANLPYFMAIEWTVRKLSSMLLVRNPPNKHPSNPSSRIHKKASLWLTLRTRFARFQEFSDFGAHLITVVIPAKFCYFQLDTFLIKAGEYLLAIFTSICNVSQNIPSQNGMLKNAV